MSRSLRDRRPAFFFSCGLVLSLHSAFVGLPTARAQEAPVILHEGVECLVVDQHAIFEAVVQPSADIRVVRLYFRSALYPEFYFLDMTEQDGRYRAVLPKPRSETKRVIYYIEAVTNDFTASRTANYEPYVRAKEDDCDDDDVVPAYFTGVDPNIVIGLTQAGLPAIPPGFYAAGLAGSGISRTTAALIAGGGGGAVAAIVAGSGGGSPPPAAPPATTTTSAAPTSTTTSTSIPAPSQKPTACFTTEPDPPIIEVGDSVRFDASCSKPAGQQVSGRQQSSDIVKYAWDFGDGRGGKEGRSVQRAYFSAGTFPATLTVTDSAGRQDATSQDVIVREPPSTTTTTTTIPNQANLSLSLGVSPSSTTVGNPVTFSITVTNNGPRDAQNVSLLNALAGPFATGSITVSVSGGFAGCTILPSSVQCNWSTVPAGQSITVDITVNSNGTGSITNTSTVGLGSPPCCLPGNNGASVGATIALRTDELSQISMSLTSSLETPSRGVVLRGQVHINDARVDTVVASTPFRHHYTGRAGENTVEARIVAGEVEEGRWRFDFREAPHFVRGSIQVDSGQVIALGAEEVVFRLGGAGGPPIRFRFRLER